MIFTIMEKAKQICTPAMVSGRKNTVSTWLRIELFDLRRAHAHLLQDGETLAVVVPFRDLLIVHDKDRRHQEEQAQENAEEEERAVHGIVLVGILLTAVYGKRFIPVSIPFRFGEGLIPFVHTRISVDNVAQELIKFPLGFLVRIEGEPDKTAAGRGTVAFQVLIDLRYTMRLWYYPAQQS